MGTSDTAGIQGIVTNAQTQAALGNVVVTLTGASLEGERETTSDTDGNYGFSALPPGTYAIHAYEAMYRAFSRDGIALVPGGTASVNIALKALPVAR